MSANAVTHTSVEHIANSLEKFAPATAVRLSERARDALRATLRDSDRRLSIPSVVTSSEVFRPDAWTAGRTDARLPAGGLLRPGRAHRLRLRERAARVPLLARATRASSSFPTTVQRSAARRASTASTRSSARRSGTALLPMVRYRTGDLVRAAGGLGRARTAGTRWGCARSTASSGASRKSCVCPQAVAHHRASAAVPHDVEQRAAHAGGAGGSRVGAHLRAARREFSSADARTCSPMRARAIPAEVNVTRRDRHAGWSVRRAARRR